MIQTSPQKPDGETFLSTWKEGAPKVNEGNRRNRAILFSGLIFLVLLASPMTSLAATTPAKPAPKAVPKPAAKPAPKVAPKPPQKVAPKPAPKPIPKPAAKPAPTAKPPAKPVPKPTPAPQTKPSPTSAPKVAPKPQAPAAKPSAPVPVKPAAQTKPPVTVPTPPTKPQVPAKPPSPPASVLPEANSSLLSIPTGQAPPAGTTVLLKHFGAVAQGKGLEMTETLYDFETMARRVAGEEWVKLSPAGQRYLVQLLMVFFKANMTLPGLGDMIRHVKFKSVTGGNLEGYTLIRYEQTFEGPYKGLVRDEQAGLLLTGQNNQYKIVDTEKEGKLLSRFLKESLAEIRKEKPETTLLAFVQEMVMNHAGNLVEMEGSLKQIKEQATANQAKPPGTSP